MIRLADLDPQAVGREAHQRVVDQAHTLAMAVGCSVQEGEHPISDLRHAMVVLAHYARTGEPPGDAPIEEYLISTAPLYTRASDQGSYTVPDLDGDVDPSTSWGLVIVAACARDLLARNQPITSVMLAALGGVEVDSIRKLTSRGELTAIDATERPRRYRAAEARRWLSARGVPGFAR